MSCSIQTPNLLKQKEGNKTDYNNQDDYKPRNRSFSRDRSTPYRGRGNFWQKL